MMKNKFVPLNNFVPQFSLHEYENFPKELPEGNAVGDACVSFRDISVYKSKNQGVSRFSLSQIEGLFRGRNTEKGVTLIELLVALSVLIILSSIAVPIYLNQTGKARDAVALDSTRTVGGLLSNARSVDGYASITGGVVVDDKVTGGVLEVGPSVFDVSARLGLSANTSVVPSFSGILPKKVEWFCVEVRSDSGSVFHMTEEGGVAVSGECPDPYPPL